MMRPMGGRARAPCLGCHDQRERRDDGADDLEHRQDPDRAREDAARDRRERLRGVGDDVLEVQSARNGGPVGGGG
jgi:hypothetical protein